MLYMFFRRHYNFLQAAIECPRYPLAPKVSQQGRLHCCRVQIEVNFLLTQLTAFLTVHTSSLDNEFGLTIFLKR